MSNEITVTAMLSVLNGNHDERFAHANLRFDQTTQGAYSAIQSVGTSEENIAVGDVAAGRFVAMRNLDATNYVSWGQDHSSTMRKIGRLRAGSVALFELEPGETIRAQANTAACRVKVVILET